MAGVNKITTDHEKIKRWAEERGGKPAIVKGTGARGHGILRINFPGYAQDSLEDISWDEFFEAFDDRNLALLYQEKTSKGKPSRFSKFVSRESVGEEAIS
jgi:hypothetical protein